MISVFFFEKIRLRRKFSLQKNTTTLSPVKIIEISLSPVIQLDTPPPPGGLKKVKVVPLT